MKKIQLNKLSAILLASSSFTLASCNGEAGSQSGSQAGSGSLKAVSLHATAKKPIFAQSECLTAQFSGTTGAGQGGHTLLTVSNHCAVTVNMDKHPAVFYGVDNHGENVYFGYHGSGGVVHEKDNWNASTATLMAGEYFEATPASAEFHNLRLRAGEKVVYDVPVQADSGAKFDQNAANASMYIVDADAPVEKADGVMLINIDTTKAGCNLKTNNCAGLQVTINDAQGSVVQSFVVPKEYLGQEYVQPVDGLYNKQKYTVNVLPIEHTKAVVSPKTITLSAEDISKDVVSVKITKDNSVKTGTVKISLPTVLDSYTGTLHIDVINTKAGNEVVASADLKQGKTFNAKLPVSDANHEYVVKTRTGLADIAQNKYFIEGDNNHVQVKSGAAAEFTIPMLAAKHETRPLTVKVTGLAQGDAVDLNFQDLGNKYSYASTKLDNSAKYQVETGLTLGVSASAQKSKVEYNNGVVIKEASAKAKSVTLAFHQGKNPHVDPEIKTTNKYKWIKTAANSVSAVSASPDGTQAVITDYNGQIKLLDVKSNKLTDLGYKSVHPLIGNVEQRVDVNWQNGKPRVVVVWGADVQYFDGITWKSLPTLPYSSNSRVDMAEIAVDWSNTVPQIAIASNQYDLGNFKSYGVVYLYNTAKSDASWDEIYSNNRGVGHISLAPTGDKVVFYAYANSGDYGADSIVYYNNGSQHTIANVYSDTFAVDWSKAEPRIVYGTDHRVELVNLNTHKTTVLYKFEADYEKFSLNMAQVSVKWEANDANVKAVIAMENGAVAYVANGRTTELFAPVANWNENWIYNPQEIDPMNPFMSQVGEMKVNWNSGSTIPSIVLTRMVNEVDAYGWYTGEFYPAVYGYNGLDGNWYAITSHVEGGELAVVWGQSGFAEKIMLNSPLEIATLK